MEGGIFQIFTQRGGLSREGGLIERGLNGEGGLIERGLIEKEV